MKLMIYDASAKEKSMRAAWFAGGLLHKRLGGLDAYKGVHSLDEALEWLSSHEPEKEIKEIQFWGHGWFGKFIIGKTEINVDSIKEGSPTRIALLHVKKRLAPGATIWFRSCATFATKTGHVFAEKMSEFFQCRIAAHTHIIGPFQSGLYTINPREAASDIWAEDAGLDPKNPSRARWSGPFEPRTIIALRNSIPRGW